MKLLSALSGKKSAPGVAQSEGLTWFWDGTRFVVASVPATIVDVRFIG